MRCVTHSARVLIEWIWHFCCFFLGNFVVFFKPIQPFPSLLEFRVLWSWSYIGRHQRVSTVSSVPHIILIEFNLIFLIRIIIFKFESSKWLFLWAFCAKRWFELLFFSFVLTVPFVAAFLNLTLQLIPINQSTRCNNLSSLLLGVYVQLNMFRAFSRPSSRAQQLQ
jgi:hypothetical protein